MKQTSMFDEPLPAYLNVRDEQPNAADIAVASRQSYAEPKRMGGQRLLIVERLRRGPATNRELSQIGLKYTGRIHELREAGYCIDIVKKDNKTGLVWYALKGEPGS